ACRRATASSRTGPAAHSRGTHSASGNGSSAASRTSSGTLTATASLDVGMVGPPPSERAGPFFHQNFFMYIHATVGGHPVGRQFVVSGGAQTPAAPRSEERRVGKESRAQWAAGA